ncbi:MAG TPA: sulfate permease [Gemmataceae bacterium]|jgi:SulP family sulfate permease|nr:sulfate permease [Gemmataceae bacterium]
MFHPKLLTCLGTYDKKQFLTDLAAGIVVGIVALPLAMAFAIASGVSPEKGLYTAIVAGFLISALGGSRVQIGGPTGAFVVLVCAIVKDHGLDGLALCTLMAGGILILLGLLRLGGAIKYIPYPVITGFTSGIAVIIFSSQIKDLLGMTTGTLPGHVSGQWLVYLQSLGTINWAAAGIAGLCIWMIVYLRRYYPRVPATLVAMVVATVLVQIAGLHVDTIGSRFGDLPRTLPRPELPHFSLERMKELWSPALSVALLAAIESLLSAVVADGMIGGRHRPNTELIAQGIANLCSPIFGGIPATGAIARTATNVKNGARTPVAGMVHAVSLLLFMLVFGRWARLVPMCSLAAILVIVSYHMSEWRAFRSLFRAPRQDLIILLATFILTVVFDLSLAVQVGVVLAALLFVKRMADMTRVGPLQAAGGAGADELADDPGAISKRQVPRGVEVYEIQGPLFFGAADKLRNTMPIFGRPPTVMILRLRQVPVIDATGLHALVEFHKECARLGTHLILAGVQPNVLVKLHRWPESEAIGANDIVRNIDHALARAREIVGHLPTEPKDGKEKKGKRVA